MYSFRVLDAGILKSSHQQVCTSSRGSWESSVPLLVLRIVYSLTCFSFPGKESTCKAGDFVRSLGWEDPLEKGMAAHSSILAWRIAWTEELGGLQSTGWQRVRHAAAAAAKSLQSVRLCATP